MAQLVAWRTAQPGRTNPPPADLESYRICELLGEGTFGVVHRAQDIKTGRTVAIKRLRLDPSEEGVPGHTMREISFLRSMCHDNIVQLLDVYRRGDRLYLVFESLDCDLRGYLDSVLKAPPKRPPPRLVVKTLLHQILRGVQCCHLHGVLHRDLKPQNLLINRATMAIKLADFGLARNFSLPLRAYTHEVVTLWYRAPEILLGGAIYTSAVDVWSVGCIFAELASGRPLFPGEAEIDQLFKIFQLLGTPDDQAWPGVSQLPDYSTIFPKWQPKPAAAWFQEPCLDQAGLDLLSRMLAYQPNKRITAQEALMHPYFADLPPSSP